MSSDAEAKTTNLGTTAEGLVLCASEDMPAGTPVIKGYDFNSGIDYDRLFASFKTTGFQAANLGEAIEEVKKMVRGGVAHNLGEGSHSHTSHEGRAQPM